MKQLSKAEVFDKYFNIDAIKLAYHRVLCWSDKMVKDQVGLKAFGQNLDANCELLSNKLASGNYSPQRGFKFYMPKPSRTLRTKTMLVLEDALVYQAIANKIAEINQPKLAELDDFVFGSVLTPDVVKGVALLNDKDPNYFFFKFWKGLFQKFKESVLHSIQKDKVKYKFETDITGFFDSIPHYNLLLSLSENFGVEDEILDLLANCFNVWSGTKESITPGVGIPQGPLPSFFFANLILHNLDDLIIGHGYKYYRYMDDINIYGYSESELLEALLLIDKYTKGHGLSINSKKTSIDKIGDEEEKVIEKELKKISFFSIYGEEIDIDPAIIRIADGDDIDNPEKFNTKENKKELSEEDKLSKKAYKLSDQDQGGDFNQYKGSYKTLKDEKEIIAFWYEQQQDVVKSIKELFENPNEEIDSLTLKNETEDIDFINLSVQYSSSHNALRELGQPSNPDESLIKYWLYAYQKFFWRANNIGITLGIYGDNKTIKNSLLRMYDEHFKQYEWVRYFILLNLSLNHSFSDKELRLNYFKILKDESSELVKISLYRLLFKHSKSKQFSSSLRKELQKESSSQLKMIIADFNRNQFYGELDMVEFLNSIGL